MECGQRRIDGVTSLPLPSSPDCHAEAPKARPLASAKDVAGFVIGLGELRFWAREPKVKLG